MLAMRTAKYVHDLRQEYQMYALICYCHHGERFDAALVRQSMPLCGKDAMSLCH